jgi:hypothetical protein
MWTTYFRLMIALTLLTTRAHGQPGASTEAPPGATAPIAPPAPGSAGALTPPGLQPAAPVTEFVPSYRGQIVVADLASLGLFWFAAHQADSSPGQSAASLAVGTYVLGGPLIHFGHGEGARGLASLALRVALPYFGAALTGDHQEDAAFGAVIGAVSAMLIDAAVIAPEAHVREVPRPSVAPQFVARPGYLGAGLGGSF